MHFIYYADIRGTESRLIILNIFFLINVISFLFLLLIWKILHLTFEIWHHLHLKLEGIHKILNIQLFVFLNFCICIIHRISRLLLIKLLHCLSSLILATCITPTNSIWRCHCLWRQFLKLRKFYSSLIRLLLLCLKLLTLCSFCLFFKYIVLFLFLLLRFGL